MPSQFETQDVQRSMLVLSLTSFGTAAANSVIFAALSDLQDKYGFTDAKLGFIASAGFFCGLLTQLFIAPIADRGNPKRLITFGLLMAIAGSVIFAAGDNIALFMLGRGAVGISLGSVLPANRAIAAHLAPTGQAERLGRLASMEMAGFVVGPLIGGLMLDPFGIPITFLTFGVLALITLIALAPTTFPVLPANDTSRKISLGLLRIQRLQVAILVGVSLYLPIGIYDALWDRYITDRGGSNFMVGISFAGYSLPFVIFATRGGRLSDKFGAMRVALFAMFFIAPVTAAYGFIAQPWLIIGVSLIEGSMQALANPAAQSLVHRAAPEGRAVAAQGLNGATTLLVAALSALVAPSLYGAFGSEWTFGMISVFMLMLLLLAAWYSRILGDPAATSADR
jgi:MFS family permease